MSRQQLTVPKKLWIVVLLIVLSPILLPLAFISVACYFTYRIIVYLLIWIVWIPRGKSVLFVYSDSPIWREYMLAKILPLVKEHAVVMNWSERNHWSSWAFRVHVFRCFGGSYEFNPLVVIFRPFRRAQAFRFWPAFNEWKQGYQGSVEYLREELSIVLDSDGEQHNKIAP